LVAAGKIERVNMAYRTLESVLHPDGHLALPSDEMPPRPVRVMVTILEDTERELLTDDEEPPPTKKVRSPRLAFPEQSKDFVKEVIGVTDASL
jgi:hypothetical protein